ncbi:MAG: SRPBCC family protein [Haloferacaceae archaeon]
MPVSLRRTPDGRRIDVARTVRAPAGRAWDLLRDPERWPEWGPGVAAVDCPADRIRRGTEGRVRVVGLGAWVSFRITACEERRWAWRVAGVPATGHRVEPRDEGRSTVAVEVPPAAAPYVPVCRRALSRFAALAEGR